MRFEDVSFKYPGARDVRDRAGSTLHIPPGSKLAIVGENGSGKTTLIKLLTRLYEPTEGRILLDGRDLREWSPDRAAPPHRRHLPGLRPLPAHRRREHRRRRRPRVRGSRRGGTTRPSAASPSRSSSSCPGRYDTQLGKWFKDGRELSLGQWQKVALSRSFMRRDADILVLDEPTASMDAEAEVKIFERFRELTEDKIAIVISHRFSTVRMADQIIVLDRGSVIERGTHEELLALGGRYATLFNLQAQGYR